MVEELFRLLVQWHSMERGLRWRGVMICQRPMVAKAFDQTFAVSKGDQPFWMYYSPVGARSPDPLVMKGEQG